MLLSVALMKYPNFLIGLYQNGLLRGSKKISPKPNFDLAFVIKIFSSEQRLLVAFCQKTKICTKFCRFWLVQGAEKKISPNPIFNGTFVIKIFHSEQRLIAAFCRKINICKNLMRTANRFLPFWPVQGAEKKFHRIQFSTALLL